MTILSNRAKNLKPSPTLAITAKAKSMTAQGIHVISFGAGEPDFDTPDNIKQAAIKAIEGGFTKYTAAGGIDELKDAVIQKFQRDNQLTFKRSQILISCGGKHSIYNLAQALFDQGEEVIIPAPYWVSYPAIVELADATPVIVETTEEDDFKINPEDLVKTITPRTKALVLNSPSNPTGSAYTKGDLEKIADIVVSKNIFVISDEIYEKIIYDGFRFVSIASLGEEIRKRTIIVHGVAKDLCHDRLEDRLYSRARRDHHSDEQHPEPEHLQSELDRPEGLCGGPPRPSAGGGQDGFRLYPSGETISWTA